MISITKNNGVITGIAKNSGTPTNISKHSGTFTDILKKGLIGFITTDTPDYVLVGSSEDEFLIFDEGDVLTSFTKNSGTLTNILKN